MELRGTEKPLTWRYELSGGAILGSDARVSESQPLAEAKQGLDSSPRRSRWHRG